MFKCDKCGNLTKPGDKEFHVNIERNSPLHPGKEIEKELKFCPRCKDIVLTNVAPVEKNETIQVDKPLLSASGQS